MFKLKSVQNPECQLIVNKLMEASRQYYAGTPIMSDTEFDTLEDKLKSIDPTNSWFTKLTRETAEYGTKVRHLYRPVGSIDKIHSIKESKLIALNKSMSISLKLDGTSMVVYYVDGKVDKAVTRGDGVYGIDVTSKYLKICEKYCITIPENFAGAIRGEVVLNNHSWEVYKELHPEAKMARNVGTGLLNRKEVSDDLQFVDWVVYDIIAFNDTILLLNEDSYNMFQVLKGFGYPICPNIVTIDNTSTSITTKSLEDVYNTWREQYPADGLVFEHREKSSFDSKEQVNIWDRINEAYKFPAEEKQTTVTDVEWNFTRTGKLVPTVVFESVFLSGASVSRASGYNYKFIKDNKIQKGAIISVRRSNEVIPEITKVISVPEEEDMNIPLQCPVCGETLISTATDVDLICPNDLCEGKAYNRVCHFIKSMCKGVKGVGDAYVEHLMSVLFKVDEKYSIQSLLYKLFESDLLPRPDFSKLGNAERKLTEEQVLPRLSVANMDPYNFLVGLGIPLFGETFAKELSVDKESFNSIIFSTKPETMKFAVLKKFPGRVEMSNKFEKYFDVISSIVYSSIYQTYGQFKFEDIKETHYYAVTGSVSVPRKVFEEELKNKGWLLTDNITKCEVLINNDTTSSSSKNIKAQKAGKPIVSEQQFRENYLI